MKITLCGSTIFYDEMLVVKKKLEQMNHEVELPSLEIKDGDGNMISEKEYYQIRKSANEDEKWV